MIRRLLPWGRRLTAASVAPIAEFALRLLRTIILSRLLAPDEFGTAMALVAVILSAELISDLGLDRYVMVGAREKMARHMAAAHALGLMRGLVQAMMILALSPLLAAIFGVAALWPAFAAAGLVPLIRGFSHLGIKQLQRDYRFAPEAMVTIGAQVLALGATFAAAMQIASAWAVLPGFLVEAMAMVVGTRLAVGTRFETDFSRESLRDCFRYAWPFLGNGIALAVIMQADRFVVGGFLGPVLLGIYAAIMSLSVTPVYAYQRVVGSVLLPLSIALRDGPGGIAAAARLVPWLYLAAGFLAALALALLLDVLTPLLFGNGFQVPTDIHVLAVLVAFFRFTRSGPVCVFLVTGHTTSIMAGTLIAGAGLAISLGLVIGGAGIDGVLAGIIVGEVISYAASLVLLVRLAGARAPMAFATFMTACAMIAALAAMIWFMPDAALVQRSVIGGAGLALLALLVIALLRQLRRMPQGEAMLPDDNSLRAGPP